MPELSEHLTGSSPALIFAGGGSGGHLFPGLAVAEEFRKRIPQTRILFVGSERNLETKILSEAGFDHISLPILPSTLLKKHPFRFANTYRKSVKKAATLLAEFHPSAIIGLGGFASVPVCRTAFRKKVPVVLLEQNTVPGRATRWLAPRATAVCLSFAQSEKYLPNRTNCVLTGNPVRTIFSAMFESSRKEPEVLRLLILGGSQGATAVNNLVARFVETHAKSLQGWKIVHQSGGQQVQELQELYNRLSVNAEVAEFFTDLPARISQTTLVISRAGATTLAELACAGCPSVLIPYPNSVGDHQQKNAEVFASAGASFVLNQEIASQQFADTLLPLLLDVSRRQKMRAATRSLASPDATENVVQVISEIIASTKMQ